MEISCLKENLQRPVSLLSKYVSSRPALPVLANILIEVTDQRIILSATNLEVTIKSTVPADIKIDGRITVQARPLAELVNILPQGPVTLLEEQDQLIVTSGRTSSSFPTITAQDFPALPSFSQAEATGFPLDLLREIAEKVLFAAATDESRPVLTCLLIKQTTENLVFVATDGFRLSEMILPVPDMPPLIGQLLLLPAKIIAELIRLGAEIGAKELWIDTASQTNQVALKVGDVECYSKLIEATYPDYTRIIPTEYSASISLEREALLQAVKLAMVFAKEAGSLIKCDIQPQAGEMVVYAQSANIGQNHTSIPIQGTGEDMVIACNSRFIIEALNALKETEIRLDCKGPLAPIVLTSPNLPNFRHLIMPIKTDE
jgi:DNA polymerase-3 subunit beta